ncbi:D-glucuronate isomerase [Aliiruegeria haliotis]|uniref:Uronate isomerase n=1 Tax=Aliiruegeria haliotis TaxID=1280846 RepID=A0A2T0RDX1_9RHOB|nr:glucuronate isomerase [Aliiruegeria haliotis]PRY19339.1 D-glucuronate isomerase [Aliiruegeria haliotis]
MANFMDDTLLLNSKTAVRLFEDHAKACPVLDFHCHLDPVWIADDTQFDDVVDAWLTYDPYKWRAMRINGIAEERITGNASKADKFAAWAETLPRLAGNPLFHWSYMELKQFFGVEALLTPETADAIHAKCNERLSQPGMSARGILSQLNVEMVCTSDDLLDSLDAHRRAVGQTAPGVLPSLRADSVVAIDSGTYAEWLKKLGKSVGFAVESLDDLERAVSARLDVFDALGCCVADLGLDRAAFVETPRAEASGLLDRLLSGENLDAAGALALKSWLIAFLGTEYARRNWVMQLHVGAHRYTSSRLRELVGAAGGFACMGPSVDIIAICSLLDHLESQGSLPRTILFNLNPTDTAMFASVTGSFVEDGVPGKVQYGPAWWYNDHEPGMRNHLEVLASTGVLGRFIGMTTDSRSVLSYVRHEYFRRILCDTVGTWVEAGKLPGDARHAGQLIEDICVNNARSWLNG